MSLSRKKFLTLTGLATATGLVRSSTIDSKREVHHPLIKPKRLKKGATLGLVAPASPIYSSTDFDKMIIALEELGYKLKLGQHVRDRKGYLAGEDKDRANDLLTMFKDNEIDGIICTRGGWGSNRILDLIDFSVIKENPKVFVGFSDITSLHLAILKNTGLVTFHGPVGKSDWNAFTTEAWDSVLIDGDATLFKIPDDQSDSYTITKGVASGKLLGGNLTVLTSLIGSKYLPKFDNSILFLEDIGESAYKIDRMLTQLRLSGILEKVKGFVFGKCTECDAGENSLTLKEVFEDHLSLLDIPAFYGAMISHEDKNITLPMGIQATIDATKKTIRLDEPGVI